MGYLLGVDGGNTKTDYLICTEDGAFVDVYRCGSCSHESNDNGYEGMERVMRKQLDVILSRNNIRVDEIAAGGFGLAGSDLPSQTAELKQRVSNIGFKCFNVSNDGILGVKATSDSGVGVCVVNGTSTVVVGIDQNSKIQQVGGVSDLSGDLAGGTHVFKQCLYHLYAYHFRCGDDSSMFPAIMEILNVTKGDLMEVTRNFWDYYNHIKGLIQLADREAQKGDKIAMFIFDEMAKHMGQSVAGCVRLLDFGDIGTDERPLPIVLVGSIWHKVAYPGMKTVFEKTVTELSMKTCQFVPLNAPSAVGGVLWAKEMLDNKTVNKNFRDGVLNSLTLEKYESLV